MLNAWDPAKDEAAGEQCRAYGAGGVMRLADLMEMLIAEAHFVLASVRRDTFETVPIPDELRNRLALYTRHE